MQRVVGMILAGGQGERLSILSQERAKPAVPFGGKYRLIDFTLSNCVNSGIDTVAILTQYRPRSLNDHIGSGRAWDLDRNEGGVFLLQPYTGRGESDWYRGTADAVYQNLYFIEERRVDDVLILAGDHVYQMRYDLMIDFHRRMGADATVGVLEVPWEDVGRFGTLEMEEDGRITGFQEKVPDARSNLASMGIYVFGKHVLQRSLLEDAHRRTTHDFGRDILPSMVENGKVYGYRFAGYWRDVGTLESYWQANMDLLEDPQPFDFHDPDMRMYTHGRSYPAARIGPGAHVNRSLICEGCVVDGYVEHSVLSPGVRVEEGAVVRDSIIFDDVRVEQDATINRCVIDKEVRVGRGSQLGWGDDATPNRQDPGHLYSGITVVGKRAVLPAGLRVGRNCKIGPGVETSDFETPTIPSGETIMSKQGLRLLL